MSRIEIISVFVDGISCIGNAVEECYEYMF